MAVRLGARHAVITNARHSPNVEQPEQTVRVLLEFWADVEDAQAADRAHA
jgi:pimeloyl-ACP methyl ester carboxylesterase